MKYLLLTALFAIGSTHAMDTVNEHLAKQTTQRIIDQAKVIEQKNKQPLGADLAKRNPRTLNWLCGVGMRGSLLNRKKVTSKK